MASMFIRNLPKPSLLRGRPNVSQLQTKDSSSSTSVTPQNPIVVNNSPRGIYLVAGVSLGISAGLLGTNIQKILEPEVKLPPPAQGLDPELKELMVTQSRQFIQLQNRINTLDQEIRHKNHESQQQPQTIVSPKGAVDVVDLSIALEANNIANANYYKKQLAEQRKSLLREHMLKVEGEILKVENKYKPLINKVKQLESHYAALDQLFKKEGPAKILWISCQSLLSKLQQGPQEPLETDPAYQVLKDYAANNNQLAQKVIDSIPPRALQQGIQSEDKLIYRFSKVESMCKKVALVGESEGLGKYLISYLQSLFVLDNIEVCEEEVLGKKLVDPTCWSTFDIIARVKYCLLNRNLEQAIRYANQLKGQARVVARDWIRDARSHLETRQAFSILSTHAEAIAVDAANQSFE